MSVGADRDTGVPPVLPGGGPPARTFGPRLRAGGPRSSGTRRSQDRRRRPPRFPDARLVMLALALALAAAGLGRPVLPMPSAVYRHLVVFDVTQSMNVEDAAAPDGPRSRLEHAKAVVLDAAAALPCGSEIGLGLFTGHRVFLLFAPVEVCANYGDLSATVRAVDWRMAWTARSEIAKGVHSGLAAAKALGPRTTLVFLTDGHEAPPLHPELRPRFAGEPGEVRGLLAGVGGLSPASIPKLDPRGRRLGEWRAEDVMQVDTFTLGRSTSVPEGYAGIDDVDVQARIAAGTEHLSALREEYLRSLARGLRLQYRRVESADDLAATLEHPDFAIRRASPADFRPPLAVAAALLVAGSYLFPSWRRRVRRRAYANVLLR